MGASNVMAAYAAYAGRVPATSMQILAYMAVVSRDEDRQPWYGQGHQALAEHALGRPTPIGKADTKAVERAIAPLAAIGAITTDRRASLRRDGAHTVRYRLNLSPSTSPGNRGTSDVPETGQSGAQDSHRPPETVPHVPRKTGSRPPKNVPTSPEIRGTEEPGGTRRSDKTKEEENDLRTAVTVPRAHEAAEDPIPPPVEDHAPLRLIDGNPTAQPTTPAGLVPLFPAAVPDPPDPARPPLPRSPFRRPDIAADTIAEAQARRAARIAAHQAAIAAGGTP